MWITRDKLVSIGPDGVRVAVDLHANFLNGDIRSQLSFGIGDRDLIACDRSLNRTFRCGGIAIRGLDSLSCIDGLLGCSHNQAGGRPP
jgi:hypothetical protein